MPNQLRLNSLFKKIYNSKIGTPVEVFHALFSMLFHFSILFNSICCGCKKKDRLEYDR